MRNLFNPLILLITLPMWVNGYSTENVENTASSQYASTPKEADGFFIVDCLLPETEQSSRRRPIKTSAWECELYGGYYLAYDYYSGYYYTDYYTSDYYYTDYATALEMWLTAAENDPEAQTYIGEIYEKGFGAKPDHKKAAQWYQKAAAQGHASAQMNLGFLHERGLGVKQDSAMAGKLYRQAAGLTQHTDIKLVAPTHSESEELARLRQELEQTKHKLADAQTQLQAQQRGAKRRRSKNKPRKSGSDKLPLGTYHALIIGNNQYQQLPKLKTAVNDAKKIAELLKTHYGYKTAVLLNANRYQILNALNHLRQRLTEKDNLLIYYGGHGELDKVNQRGHWLPVDAEPESSANWISNITITDILNAMNSKHILVVSDSCYSGTMTRSSLTRLEAGMTAEKHLKWVKKMLKKQSRTALTSGGVKPVLDAGGGQHSIFAKAFIDTLEKNTEITAAYRIYRQVAALVNDAAAAVRFEQIPEYAPIRHAKHEAGEFFFVPNGTATKIAVSEK